MPPCKCVRHSCPLCGSPLQDMTHGYRCQDPECGYRYVWPCDVIKSTAATPEFSPPSAWTECHKPGRKSGSD